MFFIPIHSWALPLTLPSHAAVLPERQRRENRKGGMLSRRNRVKNQHLPGKITEQKGLNKTPQGSCRRRRPWSFLTAVTE